MKNKIIKYSLVVLAIILVSIQFIKPEKNLGQADGPDDITHFVPVPDNVKLILQHSCFDCHSNRTKYPWYFNINPIAWFMDSHIKQGKENLNFSDLSGMSERRLTHKLSIIAKEVENHDMPIGSYTFTHTNAKLNDREIKIIKNWTAFASEHITIKK